MNVETGKLYRMRCGRIARIIRRVVLGDKVQFWTALTFHKPDGTAIGPAREFDLIAAVDGPAA